MKRELPDGRVAEFVSAVWAEPASDDPPNGLPVNVTVTIDGEVTTVRIFLTDDLMREAFASIDGSTP